MLGSEFVGLVDSINLSGVVLWFMLLLLSNQQVEPRGGEAGNDKRK